MFTTIIDGMRERRIVIEFWVRLFNRFIIKHSFLRINLVNHTINDIFITFLHNQRFTSNIAHLSIIFFSKRYNFIKGTETIRGLRGHMYKNLQAL